MTVTEDATKWPEFMTIPEVAVVLRVSKMTVYRMVHRRDLEAIRAGRSFRIYSRSLSDYLRGSEVSA